MTGQPTRRPAGTARPVGPVRPVRGAGAPVRLVDSHHRLRTAVVVLGLVLSLFGGRLLQLQGLDATAYATEAERGRLHTMTLPAVRGSISDRNGIALATTVAAYDITADQTLIKDPAAAAAVLAPVLRVDPVALQKRLTGKDRFVYVAKKLTPQRWRTVRELRLPGTSRSVLGIFGVPTSERTYPAGRTAANVVGFLDVLQKGQQGIEKTFNDTLAGRDGQATFERAAGGRRIPTGQTSERDAVPGRDIRLTIDRDIQWVAQDAIARKVKETGAKNGTVIVMDPKTGNLLAVASAPTFDANNPGAAPIDARDNKALTQAYEPGSTGKVMTASALLEEGVITPSTAITVPNRLRRAGKTFKDFKDHPTQHLTYAGTIAKSSNIGTILAAERLGDLKRLYPYFDKFGIGHATGLGFTAEAKGRLRHPDTWSATTGYTSAFGQGYSVNAVQMASVFATIANNGVRVAPRLVAARGDPTGKLVPTKASARTRVVSAKTATTVRLMMETVLGEGGTAPAARIPGYRVAGKTGTAQRYNPTCRCYNGFTMSFIGLAPVDKPALVVAVTLQAPKSGVGGGSTGGPVFKEVMSFALQSLRIPPTGTKPPGLKISFD